MVAQLPQTRQQTLLPPPPPPKASSNNTDGLCGKISSSSVYWYQHFRESYYLYLQNRKHVTTLKLLGTGPSKTLECS